MHADASADARAHYERAFKLYEEADYDAALAEMTRAYELNPSYLVLYNIAQVRAAMKDHAGAVESFQRYLREGGGQISNERVAQVREQIADLQQRVGKLTIECDVADSEVLIDDVVVGTTPLARPVSVNAGTRRVIVRHPAHSAQTKRISITGGETQSVALALRTRPGAQDLEPAPERMPPSRKPRPELGPLTAESEQPSAAPSRALPIMATTVTGALAASAIVFGIVALNQNGDLEARRNRPDEDRQAFDEDRARMSTVALLADGLGVLALAGAGISTWLWLRAPSARADQAHAKSGVKFTLAPLSARLNGAF